MGRRLKQCLSRSLGVAAALLVTLLGTLAFPIITEAGLFWGKHRHHHVQEPAPGAVWDPAGGQWFWLRSPDQERRVMISLFNRYCIRCHGADGRGVWDIPDVPNLTNPNWQMTRTDRELTHAIIEGRGACMPPFRGTLSLEEACAMARYLRTFVPGTEISRPVIEGNEAAQPNANAPAPVATPAPPPAAPGPNTRAPFAP
jgi:hypothetical protein